MPDSYLENAGRIFCIFVGNCLKDEGAARNANIPYLQAKWGEEMCAHNEFSSADELLAKLDAIARIES